MANSQNFDELFDAITRAISIVQDRSALLVITDNPELFVYERGHREHEDKSFASFSSIVQVFLTPGNPDNVVRVYIPTLINPIDLRFDDHFPIPEALGIAITRSGAAKIYVSNENSPLTLHITGH
jgi:hypothetical protein